MRFQYEMIYVMPVGILLKLVVYIHIIYMIICILDIILELHIHMYA